MKTCITVVDRTHADIYERTAVRGPLSLIRSIQNPKGRLQDKEIDADRPGVNRALRGVTPNTYSREQDGQAHIADVFMHALAEELSQQEHLRHFDSLILAAEPKMLGQLRALLPERVTKKIIGSLDKDLAHLPPRELPRYFEEFRPPVA